MRILLLILLVACPLAAQSQFFGGSFGYVYNNPSGYNWAQNHGIQIGLVQLESDRISIITDENLERDFVYTGQITDGNHQITTFTILNGVFQLTEHLTKQSIKIFMDSLKKADYSFDLCTYT